MNTKDLLGDAETRRRCIVRHNDLASTFPQIWALLPKWLIDNHTPDELHELIGSLYFALPNRLVRRAARELSAGDSAAAQQLLATALPRLLDEPCDDLFDDAEMQR